MSLRKILSSLARYIRKSGWVVLGITAPEFVAYAAWAQWRSARKLKANINKLIDEKERDSTPADQPSPTRWTMTQAFYAAMGGFVIDTKPLDGKEYIPGSPRITLTTPGIHFLALNGIIPNVAESFIKDKSKANALAKVITCMQGGWLVIQCIARLCYHLPITLLEVNTVGHVLCAFAIYLFWFSKPLDTNEPTVVSDVVSDEKLDKLKRLCALMWMNSSISSKAFKKLPGALEIDTELESLLFYGSRAEQSNGGLGTSATIVRLPSEERGKLNIHEGEILDGIGFALNPGSSRFFSEERRQRQGKIRRDRSKLRVKLDATDIQRWRMASQVLVANPELLGNAYFQNPALNPPYTIESWLFKELVCERCGD